MVLIFSFNYEYFLGFSIIISPFEEQKTEFTLTASRVCRSILWDGPPGNWHTDGAPTGARANAHWQSWASMAGCQAWSTIDYFSSEMIGQGVIVTTIASRNRFAISQVAFSFWGTSWSPPLGFCWGILWSAPALGSRRACTMSDSRNMLMDDFWHLSNRGAMAPAGCRRFGSEVWAMAVSARLHFYSSGTLVVCLVSSRRAWSRCRTSCWLTKSSSSISVEKVDYPRSSLLFSLIYRSVSLSSYFIRIIARTLAISNTILESSVGSFNIWLAIKIVCLLQRTCKCSLKVGFLILLWIVISHLAGHRFHVGWSQVGECRQKYIRVNKVRSLTE